MSRVDEQQRGHVRDDLRGILRGQLLFDDLTRSLYSTDASIFQVQPLGVVVPQDEEDVQALVRYAFEHDVPLMARGAGTGIAGESLGQGLAVDLSRNFRQILEVGPDFARVQPGVTLRALNDRLALEGRCFAPNPGSGEVCTLGGMLATNASGPNTLRQGYTRDHVRSLRVVLDSGDVVPVQREPFPLHEDRPVSHYSDILHALGVLFEENASKIAGQPRPCFDRCGYQLHDLIQEGKLDVAKLLVGSEGTLGIMTEAVVKTVPIAAGRALVFLSFASIDAALRAAKTIVPSQPSACDMMDRRLLSLARGAAAQLVAQLVPTQAEAVMLIEFEADTVAEARQAAQKLAAHLARLETALLSATVASEKKTLSRYWELREAALPSLYGIKGGAQPVPFVEDIAVPLQGLSEFVRRVQDTLQEHETTASFLIHAATGQVHTRPFLDLSNSDDVSKLPVLAESIHALALSMGGTVSTQHGTGLARTPWVARQAGPLYPIYRQIKAIFDPRGIFNPGKIVDPEPSLATWPLRMQALPERPRNDNSNADRAAEQLASDLKDAGQLPRETGANVPVNGANGEGLESTQVKTSNVGSSSLPSTLTPATQKAAELGLPEGKPGEAQTEATQTALAAQASPLALVWSEQQFRIEANHCNGCGQCRTEASNQRMCPIHRASQEEAATPRAKANLLRNLLHGEQPIASEQVRAVADLCVNCKMCALECPARVDIPRLMIEAKAANVAQHGLDRSDWFLSRLDFWAGLGSPWSIFINLALRSYSFRWLLERAFGLSRKRKLPVLASRSFLKTARRHGLTQRPTTGKPWVALFLDFFPNYFDPLIAEAAVAVLRHNGFDVYVPPGQDSGGMNSLAQGDVESAREICRKNLRAFAELAREGVPIVCPEPTATLMFTQDLLDLFDDADARAVARGTRDLISFLSDLHEQGRLRTDFKPVDLKLGHHVPCHIKAMGRAPASPAILGLIPGLQVETIDVSCSGIAGAFGLKAPNYKTSLAAGRPMLQRLAQPHLQAGSTECSACRIQMEDGAGKRTLHPIQYLALGYGLMPELNKRLHEPIRDLVLR